MWFFLCKDRDLQNNWTFWKKLQKRIFGAQNAPFERPQRPNTIWNFTAIVFFSKLRIFYIKIATSKKVGGGLRIVSWEKSIIHNNNLARPDGDAIWRLISRKMFMMGT